MMISNFSAAFAAPVLAVGSKGGWVMYLQRLLVAVAFPVVIDGIFGPETLNGVQTFQASRKLTTDGIVGPATWGELEAATGGKFPRPDGGAVVAPIDVPPVNITPNPPKPTLGTVAYLALGAAMFGGFILWSSGKGGGGSPGKMGRYRGFAGTKMKKGRPASASASPKGKRVKKSKKLVRASSVQWLNTPRQVGSSRHLWDTTHPDYKKVK